MRVLLEVTKSTGEFVTHADRLRPSEQRYYAIAGAGRFGDQWLEESSSLTKAQLDSILSDPVGASRSVAGGLILAVVDPMNKHAAVVNDPLGAGTVMTYEDDKSILVSTDIEMIVGRARELGTNLKRDPRSLGSMLVTGVTGMGWSPYVGVRIVPIFTTVTIRDSVLSENVLDFSQEVAEAKNSSFEENLLRVQDEVERNLKAIDSAARSWKIAHLTGGFDSRLVLSFLISLGMEGKYVFSCHGRPVERDREVFEILAAELGLNTAPAKYLSISGTPSTFEEELVAPLEYSSGMSLTGPTRYSMRQDGLIMSGGYGELLRASYWHADGEPNIKSPHDLLVALYKGNIQSFGGDFINPKFLAEQADVLWEMYSDALALGLDAAAAMEYIYLHRNRMFVGQQSHLYRAVNTRIDPLYSLRAAAWGLVMSTQDRQSNRGGIELMLANAPALLELPFDSEKLTASQRKRYGVFLKTDVGSTVSDLLRVSFIPTEPLQVAPVRYMPKATDEQIKFAREKKASLRQVVWSEHVRTELGRLVGKNREESGVGEVFNLKALKAVLAQPFHNRVVIRSMINIYALVFWYTG